MPSEPNTREAYDSGFTIYLFVIAGLAAMMVFSHQMIIGMTANDKGDPTLKIMLRSIQAIEVLIASFALIVACLRAYRSPLARPTTAALSILLIVWVPFGTAAFIWWVSRIRHRERQPA